MYSGNLTLIQMQAEVAKKYGPIEERTWNSQITRTGKPWSEDCTDPKCGSRMLVANTPGKKYPICPACNEYTIPKDR